LVYRVQRSEENERDEAVVVDGPKVRESWDGVQEGVRRKRGNTNWTHCFAQEPRAVVSPYSKVQMIPFGKRKWESSMGWLN